MKSDKLHIVETRKSALFLKVHATAMQPEVIIIGR